MRLIHAEPTIEAFLSIPDSGMEPVPIVLEFDPMIGAYLNSSEIKLGPMDKDMDVYAVHLKIPSIGVFEVSLYHPLSFGIYPSKISVKIGDTLNIGAKSFDMCFDNEDGVC